MHHEMFQPVTSTMHMFSQNSLQLIVKFQVTLLKQRSS